MLTTQLYFEEAANDAVSARSPYSEDGGRDTSNDDDTIFDDRLLLTLSEDGDGSLGVMSLALA